VKLALNVKTAEIPERGKKSATPEKAEKTQAALQPEKVSMKIEAKPKKNVFASMGKKDNRKDKEKEKGSGLKRPMSEAERIMKGEMERNKSRNSGPPGLKRQRVM